jgi:hypothetical protein
MILRSYRERFGDAERKLITQVNAEILGMGCTQFMLKW